KIKKRVLVTSFGSFGAVTSNPSADVIKVVQHFPAQSCEVLTHEMQVVYSEVMETVPMLWAEQKPDLVVHLGVHPDIRCVRVEQQAFSDGYCRLDADGLVPVGNKCIDNLDQTLRTSINVKRIVKKTNKLWRELEIECSDNPGRYLLGFAYYLSLCNDNSKALAIHIPPLSEKITVPLLSHIVATIIRITLHD
ncbi:hypothetical protein PMAYCL1PPCAC_19327, partial [Pristionchus mayeri]